VTIAVEESVAGGGTTGDTSTLTSWTPASNELILLFVAMRDESITPTAAGNGITFSQIHKVNNVQNLGALTVFRGLDASPSTGQITVTHTGNTDTVSCIATRFSGIDTSGSNGSGAIGNTATDTGPDPDDDDMLIGYSRAATISDPPASGETTILINQEFGSDGAKINCHVWYQTGATGSVQLGEAANLSADNDHVESAIEVKAATGAFTQAIAGTQTSSGILTRLTSIIQAGTQTSSGLLTAIKTTLASISGTQTSSGILTRLTSTIQTGTQTSSGTLTTTQQAIPIIALTLPARSTALTLPARSTALTLPARSAALTLPARSTALTLPARSAALTLPARG
jgi:hypothetical protein